jgi:hypothetical protein
MGCPGKEQIRRDYFYRVAKAAWFWFLTGFFAVCYLDKIMAPTVSQTLSFMIVMPLCIGSAIHNTVWVVRLSKKLDD